LDAAHGTAAAAEMLAAASAEEAAAAAALGVRRVGAVEDLRCLDEDLDSARCGPWRGCAPGAAQPIPRDGLWPCRAVHRWA